MNKLVVAGIEHALALAPRLRAADLAEIHAATLAAPEDVLVISLGLSDQAWAWLHEGDVVAIGGVAPHPYKSDIGVPWAFGSDALYANKDFFLAATRLLFEEMFKVYPRLENHVDARNAPAVKFLQMSGFTLDPAAPYGPLGLPFHRFHKERPLCAPQ